MRYQPHDAATRQAMLAEVGVASVDELFAHIPDALHLPADTALPDGVTEQETLARLRTLARRNVSPADVPSFLGAGYYRHHTPAALDQLLTRGEFLTAYTPYQPEISQGTLQTIFEYQTQVARLTGMEVANASMYDGATACAEAIAMACRVTKRNRALVAGGVHPHFRDVSENTARYLGIDVEVLPPDPVGIADLLGRVMSDLACVVVQTPDFFGRLHDFSTLASVCHEAGALLVVCLSDPLALGAVEPPGAMGADIVVGEGLSLALPLSFGGPGVGLFATRQKFLRQMPGRLCGLAEDEDGKRGFVLTLSTREQHIRREKATSNICTNAGLIALAFSMHVTLLGEKGLTDLAALNHERACLLADALAAIPGVSVLPRAFFNEFALTLPRPAAEVVDALAARNILGGVPVSRFYPQYPELADLLLVAATETNSEADIEAFAAALKEVLA